MYGVFGNDKSVCLTVTMRALTAIGLSVGPGGHVL